MMPCPLENESILRQEAERAGQGHLFAWWPELSRQEREGLLRQIGEIDFSLLQELVETLVRDPASPGPHALEPAPIVRLPDSPGALQERFAAKERGESLLRQGKVAALMAAGGQGTRLGFPGPKGAFPIGPVSGKPLFSFFAERILATRRRLGSRLPWYIMTSPANDEETWHFFSENSFFGFPPDDVIFFRQGTLPAVDPKGRILMAGKAEVAASPDGHGGTLRALRDSGSLDDMERRGIEEVSYFQVDNVLVRPLDPVFIGFHCLAGAEMSSKVVRKACPEEKVGVMGMRNGKHAVIEYSDLSRDDMYAADRDGCLRYWAGSIGVHMIRVAFLKRIKREGLRLPFHRAEKRVACIDRYARQVDPDRPNGIKFESFLFDALGFARCSVALEVLRNEEFSPLKNARGVDSAETARRDLMELFASWLEDAGVPVPRREDGSLAIPIEISPLYAQDREELRARIPSGFRLASELLLGEGECGSEYPARPSS